MRIKKTLSKKRLTVSPTEVLSPEGLPVNCEIKGDKIVNRPAFVSKTESPVYRDIGAEGDESYPVVTECEVYLEGRLGRIVVNVRDNLLGNLIFEMKLVYPEGDSTPLGSIEFARSPNGDTGYPTSFTVFSGRSKTGAGIYFLCRQEYSGESEDFYRIMELSEDRSYWRMLTESDMFVPVLLANGRGDGWYRAAPYGEPLELPDPISPQSRNMLSSAFYSYFTTDSTSAWFTLPEENLDDAAVTAEFLYVGDIYRFAVKAGEEISNELDVDGTNVVMKVSRERGDLCFIAQSGAEFPLPYGRRLNNLKITAYKTRKEDLLAVCSARNCLGITSSVSNGESDMTVFYGGRLNPSVMFWNSPVNPLYFPAESRLSLGENGVMLDRILSRGKTLFAFKEDKVFISETAQYKGEERVFDDEGFARKVGSYEILFKKALSLPSTPIPKSICSYGERVVFADLYGDIYGLEGSEFKRLYSLPTGIDGSAFALTDKRRYLLFYGKTAFVLTNDGGKSRLYKWSFDENILGGFSYMGRLLLLGLMRKGAEVTLFPVLLTEDGEDRVSSEEGERRAQISAELSVTPFKPPEQKRLLSLYAEGEGETVITVFENGKTVKSERTVLKRGGKKIFCGFKGKRPEIKLSFSGAFSLVSLTAEYATLNII